MKKYFFTLFAICLATFLQGCYMHHANKKDSGTLTEKNYSVGDFKTLIINGIYNISLINSNENKIRVVAGENIIDKISIKSSNEKLSINFEGLENYNLEGTIIYIPVTNLKSISTSGVGNLFSESLLKFDELAITTTGVCKINMELEAKKLDINASDVTNIHLKGASDMFNLNCNGAGSTIADKFIVKNIQLKLSGVCKSSLHSTENISGEVQDVSGVTIYGNPKKSRVNSSDVSYVNYQ